MDTTAAPATVFRWLCQLRAAPYSYDWIDNLGRRSPRTLTPGLDQLEIGQRFMTVFRLASFESGASLTLRAGNRIAGDFAVTYAAPPGRVLMRMCVVQPGGPVQRQLRAAVFPALDLVMARKQLLTLAERAEIAERTSR